MLPRRRLRTFRTLFVHRWHAAQTIGEWLGNDEIGPRFEHINHARSLVEYVWRHGPFAESPDGTGRVPVSGAGSLKSIVRPVARRGRRHLANAVRYAALFGRASGRISIPGGAQSEGERTRSTLRSLIESRRRMKGASTTESGRALIRYASKDPDIEEFATRLIGLHLAMLPYYVQMRYLTTEEARDYSVRKVPVLVPLGGADGSRWKRSDDIDAELTGDLVMHLRGVFTRNIYNALACRARAELFETLTDHPQTDHIAAETEGVKNDRRFSTATALVDGMRKDFVVYDDALASMLDSISEKPMPALIRWLATFRIAVSTMITAMPVFIVKNFFRDTLAGFVAGRYWQVPFLGTFLGGLHATGDLVTRRSRTMREYLLQGGFYSGLVEAEVDFAPTGTGRLIGSSRGLVRRWLSRFVHLLTRPAWIAEAGTRVNQFQRARKAGATNYAAARAARMVSADFANIGSSRGWRMYVHTVPFLNAAIQGLDQLYQVVRFRSRPARSSPLWGRERTRHVTKMLLSGFCLSLMAWGAWWHNDTTRQRRAQYENQTDYEKASWVTLYAVDRDTDIRIPVPFQIGAVFVKLPEVALDIALGGNTQAGPKFGWSLIHGNLAIGWIPAVAQPFVEVYTNRNFFGDQIIPAYMKSWPPEAQYFHRSTPLPYRAAGELIGASPLHVQTFTRAWTGHFGNAVVALLDERVFWNTRAHGPRPFPRAKRLLTGVYSLQPPRPHTYTRTSNEFYALADWLEGQMVIARRNRRVPQPLGYGHGVSQRVLRRASVMRRRADEIRIDRTLTARQKELRIEEVLSDIDAAFKEALPRMRQARDDRERSHGPRSLSPTPGTEPIGSEPKKGHSTSRGDCGWEPHGPLLADMRDSTVVAIENRTRRVSDRGSASAVDRGTREVHDSARHWHLHSALEAR